MCLIVSCNYETKKIISTTHHNPDNPHSPDNPDNPNNPTTATQNIGHMHILLLQGSVLCLLLSNQNNIYFFVLYTTLHSSMYTFTHHI